MRVRIASVVEGHGEVKALPVLLRRLCHEAGIFDVDIRLPYRIPSEGMVADSVRKAVRFLRVNVGDDGVVIVLYDADKYDGDLSRCVPLTKEALGQERALVEVAVQEYEAWFLAAVESLRSHRAVQDDASYDGDPEVPRGAKEALERLMTERYAETRHQPAFSGLFDMDEAARRSPSFARFRTNVTAAVTRVAAA